MKTTKHLATTAEKANAEIQGFRSLAADPTSMPSATSTLLVGAMIASIIVSKVA